MKKIFLFLFLLLLVSCQNVEEKEVNDLIIFSNSIVEQKYNVSAKFKLNYSNEDVYAYVSSDHGKLNSDSYTENEVLKLKSDSVVSWEPFGYGHSVCYIKIIFKEDNNIVGYGLIRANLRYIGEDDNMYCYDLCVVKSVVYKLGNVNEEYVLEEIEKCIDSYVIPPLGGDD